MPSDNWISGQTNNIGQHILTDDYQLTMVGTYSMLGARKERIGLVNWYVEAPAAYHSGAGGGGGRQRW